MQVQEKKLLWNERMKQYGMLLDGNTKKPDFRKIRGSIDFSFFAWCLGMTKQMPAQDWFSRFMMIQGTTTTMYLMLIFSCFAGGMGFCEEYEKKFYRKIIQKKGIRAYALGQIGAAATVTFGACMLGITGYLVVLMCTMPAPTQSVLQGISEAICFGKWTIEHYVIVAMIQCLLNAILAALICSITIALSAWIPNRFTVLCMPMILFWLELTLSVYVLKLPGIFDWDGVFLLLAGGSGTIGAFLGKLIFNIIFWTGLPVILFMNKVKERYQNE